MLTTKHETSIETADTDLHTVTPHAFVPRLHVGRETFRVLRVKTQIRTGDGSAACTSSTGSPTTS